MSKSGKKRTIEINFALNRFSKSLKVVNPSDKSYVNQWTAGDGFHEDINCLNDNSTNSSSNNSKSSRFNSSNSSKQSKYQSINGSKNGLKSQKTSHKLLAKQKSRFATYLEEYNNNNDNNNDINSDNIESHEIEAINEREIQMSDLSQSISNISSSIRVSVCETIISPISSPIKSQDVDNNSNFKTSIIHYFDEPINYLTKYLDKNRNECFNCETSLQMRVLKVLKSMKQSSLEFSQIDSLKIDDSKALTLSITKIETQFGLTIAHSLIFNDQNSKYSKNSEIILVFNDSITEELNSNSIIKLYPRWTQLRLKNRTIIINAFNIQIIENLNTNQTNEVIPLIIWQKQRP
jgi:hypothetical protein